MGLFSVVSDLGKYTNDQLANL